jgi:hypothetical protein
MNMSESNTLIATILQSQVMDAAAVATIGALTTAVVQIIKRSLPGDWDCYGPLFAAIVSLLGVLLWVYSAPQFPPARTDVWPIAAGWVSVFTSSVGVYQTVKMATAPADDSQQARVARVEAETAVVVPPAPERHS